MGAPTILPGANTTAQWYEDNYPGGNMGDVTDKLVFHTTETGGWPSYGHGASMPHATYDPETDELRQHMSLNRSARALRDPSGTAVRENRDRVVQIEIICSSDRKFARKHGYMYVGDLPKRALKRLGQIVAWLNKNRGLPLKVERDWLPYPDSYGNSAVRMSGPQFDRFKGVLGHMHVSGNTHGDPGVLDVDEIMDEASDGDLPDTGAPEWDGESFPGRHVFRVGKRHDAVVVLDKRLIAHGFTGSNDGDGYQAGRLYTSYTTDNVRAFQKAQGWSGDDADGYPGPVTWERLMDDAKPWVDLSKIREAAREDTDRPQGGTTPGAADDVRIVERALEAEGLLNDRWVGDGSFGSKTVEAYSEWQQELGYRGTHPGGDADGIPGETSLERLASKHGFYVKP